MGRKMSTNKQQSQDRKQVQKQKQKQRNQQQSRPVIPEREPKAPHKEIPEGYKVLSEGKANVLYLAADQSQVFYNPAMETNRDISIAMAKVFYDLVKDDRKYKYAMNNQDRPGLRILEALSATGLRSIRYARE